MEEGSCSSSHRLRELCGGGEGKRLGGTTLPGTISAAIREEFGTKTEVSHDGGFISAGWLQWQTQSAEVNATFAVSPAKPPDFVAVGPAVPARGPGAGGRGARFRAC